METFLRPATSEDSGEAAPLMAATMAGYGIQTLGLGDEKREINAMQAWFAKNGNRFSYKLSWLAVVQNQVVGLLLSFGGDRLSKLENGLIKDILKIYPPVQILRMGWRMFVLGQTHEADSDEYLVAHLAVDTTFRRKGIATRLLEKAEELARAQGFSTLTLEVEIGNTPAENLYRKVGYNIVETTEFGRAARKLSCPGYHRMVKSII